MHTAYEPVYYKDGTLPPNRPGLPPKILTWVDLRYMQEFQQDVKDLRAQSDIVVSSHHMGHKGDILDFQSEIAHAAIENGAHVVVRDGSGGHETTPNGEVRLAAGGNADDRARRCLVDASE